MLHRQCYRWPALLDLQLLQLPQAQTECPLLPKLCSQARFIANCLCIIVSQACLLLTYVQIWAQLGSQLSRRGINEEEAMSQRRQQCKWQAVSADTSGAQQGAHMYESAITMPANSCSIQIVQAKTHDCISMPSQVMRLSCITDTLSALLTEDKRA